MESVSSSEEILALTIIVNGVPEKKDYPAGEKVEEVIKSLLPAGQKQDWNQYQLSDRGNTLNPSISLRDNGVKNHDTLALTKKEGGGG
ncbi:MAG: hypothetical protein OK439_00325 [Thaumarchaeota archaeon]|nr:hypothetical protein [Nitrososphaerota archaeon]